MTRALVVYESMYGNTETIARAIGDGLGSGLAVDVVEVGAAPTVIDDDVGLVVVGGPTHAFGLSRPSTRRSAAQQTVGGITSKGTGLREWLDAVEFARSQPAAAAFDTMLAEPRWIRWLPSAGRSIDRRLRRRGVRMLTTPESFWVTAPTGRWWMGRWGVRVGGVSGWSWCGRGLTGWVGRVSSSRHSLACHVVEGAGRRGCGWWCDEPGRGEQEVE